MIALPLTFSQNTLTLRPARLVVAAQQTKRTL